MASTLPRISPQNLSPESLPPLPPRRHLRRLLPTLRRACQGTLIPYEYTIALAENAADNGVEVRTRREVRGIAKDEVAS